MYIFLSILFFINVYILFEIFLIDNFDIIFKIKMMNLRFFLI